MSELSAPTADNKHALKTRLYIYIDFKLTALQLLPRLHNKRLYYLNTCRHRPSIDDHVSLTNFANCLCLTPEKMSVKLKNTRRFLFHITVKPQHQNLTEFSLPSISYGYTMNKINYKKKVLKNLPKEMQYFLA